MRHWLDASAGRLRHPRLRVCAAVAAVTVGLGACRAMRRQESARGADAGPIRATDAQTARVLGPVGHEEGARYYVVRRGDTVAAIAGRTGVPVGTLARRNGLGDGDRIEAGQRLLIPEMNERPMLASSKLVREVRGPREGGAR